MKKPIKPLYETPKVYRLDETDSMFGNCQPNGNGDYSADCLNGSTNNGLCSNGNQNTGGSQKCSNGNRNI